MGTTRHLLQRKVICNEVWQRLDWMESAGLFTPVDLINIPEADEETFNSQHLYFAIINKLLLSHSNVMLSGQNSESLKFLRVPRAEK